MKFLRKTMASIPASILSSTEKPVGVRYFKATPSHPPLRIFYPASSAQQGRAVGWFQDTGIVPFMVGYTHMALNKHDTWTFKLFLLPVLHLISWFLPMRWRRIPGVYQDTPCAPEKKKFPLIVFSHGLTGTGQENTVLCASWAQRGYVVAQVHHTDGSSCRVELADGSIKYYEHGPSYSEYDPTFRPKQVNIRASELVQACDFLANRCHSAKDAKDDHETIVRDSPPLDLQEAIDPSYTIAAGFSFGAATAARAAVLDHSPFSAVCFLDGWFHIDVLRSAGVEFNFPQEAFEKSVSIPSQFINSQQFAGYSKLFSATQTLAAGQEIAILPHTGHQNFCDVIFWFPNSILQRLMRGAIGKADPVDAYQRIVDQSTAFFRQVQVQRHPGKLLNGKKQS